MFVDFIDVVRENPEVLCADDAAVNTALLDYQSEYAFAAFGIGFALGKLIDKDTDAFENSIKNGSISNPDDYAVMRSAVEQIIVRKDSMEIEFKCGASITKEYVR